jgi:hypothetical protein
MSPREQLLDQIRHGQQMSVGDGGRTIRPVGSPADSGAPVKRHTWGRHA